MNDPHALTEIVLLLGAAVCVVAFFRYLRLSPVLGYLVAGAAIGPHGVALIKDVKNTGAFAEFGVVLLLFMIGLELSWERLRAMRKHVFQFGTAQVALTGLGICGVAMLLGIPIEIAVIIGGGLALSSTAIVLQTLAEHGEKSTQVGRLSLAVLILQDLAVLPLLVLVDTLANPHGSMWTALGTAGVKAVIALVVILIIGRMLLRPLFRIVASLGNPELFAAATLFVVLGLAWITESAGLSLALGAFIAGLLVAETEYVHQVEADIMPYKGLLLGLFFMSVGMSVNVQFMLHNFWLIIGASFALMLFKAAIIGVLCSLAGFQRSTAVHSGLMLSQGGEFAFVLFNLAAQMKLLDNELAQTLLVMVALTMALTPLMALLGKRWAKSMEKPFKIRHVKGNEETVDLSGHIIIAGYGRVGKMIIKMLQEENFSYVALDTNPATVVEGRKHGVPVYYGDVSRREVLAAVAVDRARAAIVTHSDARVSEKTVRALRDSNPEMPIIARAKDVVEVKKLEKAGADVAIAEMFETSIQLGGFLLRALGEPEKEVNRIIELFRAEDYALSQEDTTVPEAEKI